MKSQVYSLSISGRVILDMHSLNNEGGEGNQITTRMVNIVHNDPESGKPRLASVNAISGDMFKHILAEHLYLQAKADRLSLCNGCEKFSASRAADDDEFVGKLPKSDTAAIDKLIKLCVIDDVAGNLIAPKGKKRTIPRKSVAEFGWVVGLPEVTRTESYFHVRYAAERGEAGSQERAPEEQQMQLLENSEDSVTPEQQQEEQDQEQRVEQPIFHRPASSGVYASVATFELARIGFNDISQKYAIDEVERGKRYQALMKSILYTFIEPNGAMRGTQNPHILGFSGAVVVSKKVMPAPTLSPLQDNYLNDLKRVSAALNNTQEGAIAVHEFDTMGHFSEIMSDLITGTCPYTLFNQKGESDVAGS